jgi:hypothetical protein
VAGAVALADVADAAPDAGRVGAHVAAGDRGRAGGGREQGGEHAEAGALARAVRAEEGHQLAVGDVEVEALDGDDVAALGAEDLLRPRARSALPRAVDGGTGGGSTGCSSEVMPGTVSALVVRS